MQGALFAGLDVGHDFGRQLIAHAVQLQEFLFVQPVQTSYILDQVVFDQDAAPLLPQTVDVHRAFADEVLQ